MDLLGQLAPLLGSSVEEVMDPSLAVCSLSPCTVASAALLIGQL